MLPGLADQLPLLLHEIDVERAALASEMAALRSMIAELPPDAELDTVLGQLDARLAVVDDYRVRIGRALESRPSRRRSAGGDGTSPIPSPR